MEPDNESNSEFDQAQRSAGTQAGCSRIGVAFAGFILFWVIAFMSGNAGKQLLGVYVVASAALGIGLVTRPARRSLGVGILLGLALASGSYLLLMAICGGRSF